MNRWHVILTAWTAGFTALGLYLFTQGTDLAALACAITAYGGLILMVATEDEEGQP